MRAAQESEQVLMWITSLEQRSSNLGSLCSSTQNVKKIYNIWIYIYIYKYYSDKHFRCVIMWLFYFYFLPAFHLLQVWQQWSWAPESPCPPLAHSLSPSQKHTWVKVLLVSFQSSLLLTYHVPDWWRRHWPCLTGTKQPHLVWSCKI